MGLDVHNHSRTVRTDCIIDNEHQIGDLRLPINLLLTEQASVELEWNVPNACTNAVQQQLITR